MNSSFLALIGAVIIVVLDLFWLGFLMKGFYTAIPGRGEIKLLAGVLVWLAIAVGIVYFVLPLAGSWQGALFRGAFFGFILYAVYDLTNYAVLADWPLKVVFVDIAWGTVLCGVTATALWFVNAL